MLRATASFPAAPRTRGHPMHASALTPSATGLWWHSPVPVQPQGSLDHPKISFSISLMLSERGSQALTEHFSALLRGFLATETLQMQTLWFLLFISLSWPTSGVMNQDKNLLTVKHHSYCDRICSNVNLHFLSA